MFADPTLAETFPGQHYCKTMQASVDAILLPLGIKRRVVSRGTSFVNYDNWTVRSFIEHFCQHFSQFPDRVPSDAELKELLSKSNKIDCKDPHIRVARMPDRVSLNVALAIVGGGFHEAWHTKYSQRSHVTKHQSKSVFDQAQVLLDKGVVFDAKIRGLITSMALIIEDVRIENRGNEAFPGAYQPMCDLQDFILALEDKSRKEANVTPNARSVLISCFRDLGLGYDTPSGRQALERYKEWSPQVVELMLPGGILEPLVQESRNLLAQDGVGALLVAMKVVSEIWDLFKSPDSENECCCPSCGADKSKLTVRAVRDSNGKKIPGRAEIECQVCGFKTEIDVPDTSMSFGGGDGEGDEDSDLEAEGDGYGDDRREAMRDARKNGKKKSKKAGSEKMPSRLSFDPDGDDEGMEEAEESDEDEEGDGQGASGVGGKKPASSGASEGLSDEQREAILKFFGRGAGGHHDLGRDPKNPLHDLSKDLLDQKESGILDVQSALNEQVARIAEQMQLSLKSGEALWNPWSTEHDEARFVRLNGDAEADKQLANVLVQEARAQIAYLRARFRTLFKAQEMTDTTHGVRRGPQLSPRMLVDTAMEIRERRMPQRAYMDRDMQLDTSLAVSICLDESGSMSGLQREVAKCMLAIVDPVSTIGGATFAFGFRDGAYVLDSDPSEKRGYHRQTGIRYDVFKSWEERFEHVKPRFAHTQAAGGTPMGDGVQYGLTSLEDRRETHRILVVITDGQPNHGHEGIIRRQIRLAKESNIHVVGVGIGEECRYVSKVFPDYVWAASIQEMPPLLMSKMTEICVLSSKTRRKKNPVDGRVPKVIK